jgi:hypothetical protein
MNHKTILLLVLNLIAINNLAYSQDEEDIKTDRTSVTVSPFTVPANFIQAEIGGNYWITTTEGLVTENFVKINRTDYRLQITNPSFLIRYGLLKNVEVKLAIAFQQENFRSKYDKPVLLYSTHGYNNYGWGMLQTGGKINFINGNKFIPRTAFIVNLSIPLGDYNYHTDFVSPEVKMAFNNAISERFNVNYNFGYGWNIYDRFTKPYGTYAVSISANLVKRLNAFVETYALLENHRTPDIRGGAGFSYLFAKNVIADFSGGIGFSERSPDFSLGMGISLRLPR